MSIIAVWFGLLTILALAELFTTQYCRYERRFRTDNGEAQYLCRHTDLPEIVKVWGCMGILAFTPIASVFIIYFIGHLWTWPGCDPPVVLGPGLATITLMVKPLSNPKIAVNTIVITLNREDPENMYLESTKKVQTARVQEMHDQISAAWFKTTKKDSYDPSLLVAKTVLRRPGDDDPGTGATLIADKLKELREDSQTIAMYEGQCSTMFFCTEQKHGLQTTDQLVVDRFMANMFRFNPDLNIETAGGKFNKRISCTFFSDMYARSRDIFPIIFVDWEKQMKRYGLKIKKENFEAFWDGLLILRSDLASRLLGIPEENLQNGQVVPKMRVNIPKKEAKILKCPAGQLKGHLLILRVETFPDLPMGILTHIKNIKREMIPQLPQMSCGIPINGNTTVYTNWSRDGINMAYKRPNGTVVTVAMEYLAYFTRVHMLMILNLLKDHGVFGNAALAYLEQLRTETALAAQEKEESEFLSEEYLDEVEAIDNVVKLIRAAKDSPALVAIMKAPKIWQKLLRVMMGGNDERRKLEKYHTPFPEGYIRRTYFYGDISGLNADGTIDPKKCLLKSNEGWMKNFVGEAGGIRTPQQSNLARIYVKFVSCKWYEEKNFHKKVCFWSVADEYRHLNGTLAASGLKKEDIIGKNWANKDQLILDGCKANGYGEPIPGNGMFGLENGDHDDPIEWFVHPIFKPFFVQAEEPDLSNVDLSLIKAHTRPIVCTITNKVPSEFSRIVEDRIRMGYACHIGLLSHEMSLVTLNDRRIHKILNEGLTWNKGILLRWMNPNLFDAIQYPFNRFQYTPVKAKWMKKPDNPEGVYRCYVPEKGLVDITVLAKEAAELLPMAKCLYFCFGDVIDFINLKPSGSDLDVGPFLRELFGKLRFKLFGGRSVRPSPPNMAMPEDEGLSGTLPDRVMHNYRHFMVGSSVVQPLMITDDPYSTPEKEYLSKHRVVKKDYLWEGTTMVHYTAAIQHCKRQLRSAKEKGQLFLLFTALWNLTYAHPFGKYKITPPGSIGDNPNGESWFKEMRAAAVDSVEDVSGKFTTRQTAKMMGALLVQAITERHFLRGLYNKASNLAFPTIPFQVDRNSQIHRIARKMQLRWWLSGLMDKRYVHNKTREIRSTWSILKETCRKLKTRPSTLVTTSDAILWLEEYMGDMKMFLDCVEWLESVRNRAPDLYEKVFSEVNNNNFPALREKYESMITIN